MYPFTLLHFSSMLTYVSFSFMTDEWADLQLPYPGDNVTSPGNNVYGNIKQMFLLKKKNRSLKTLLSIGGWSYREHFAPMLASETLRQNFADSAAGLVANLGFDGIDIDYEYVDGKAQAAQMVDLLKRLRSGLDALGHAINATAPFIISYASPAGKDHYTQLALPEMTPFLDFYTFMAVDYMGPGFSNHSGYLSNLFPDSLNKDATDFDTCSGIEYYLKTGQIPSQKIVMENPLYGRAFNGTEGIGKTFTDGGSQGSLGQAGLWFYKDLPVPGMDAKVVTNPAVGGSYSYDAKNKYLVSYDTPEIARLKALYVRGMQLGGMAWWDVSMDRDDDASLIHGTVSAFGGNGGLEKRLNNLNYPTSRYTNLKAGFPDN